MHDEPSRPGSRPAGEAKRTLPKELSTGTPEPRHFSAAGGAEWVARHAGRSVGGTGSYGVALLEAVFFCRAAQPEEAVLEVLVGRGRFAEMSEEELAGLLKLARPISTGAEPAPGPQRQRRR